MPDAALSGDVQVLLFPAMKPEDHKPPAPSGSDAVPKVGLLGDIKDCAHDL